MPLTDPERRTVLLAAGGDLAAFTRLVRDHQGYIAGLLRRACGDATLAEDLTQLTFLKAWRRLGSLRDPDAVRLWLRRIALNLLTDAMRRGTVPTVAFHDELAHVGQPSPESALLHGLEIDRALERLATAPRTCIVLAYGEGMSHGEIAAALKLPLGTVKSHIARGLATLRQILEVEDDDHEVRSRAHSPSR
ncbi:sigma-70 family RNA polymerase sigma factor [Phenylobacterium sp.]|uniref:RNA polymerase sigma factor n=1 Tax=Phenylobacterium sp. TaxID=1871053 RepID=UPI0025F878E0|nr:sigma-70 family RNA polymerase sigma factor [Phenylobacterium sp.]